MPGAEMGMTCTAAGTWSLPEPEEVEDDAEEKAEKED